MAGARQTIAVIITFRKCNKSWLERRPGTYLWSWKKISLYFSSSILMKAINNETPHCAVFFTVVNFLPETVPACCHIAYCLMYIVDCRKTWLTVAAPYNQFEFCIHHWSDSKVYVVLRAASSFLCVVNSKTCIVARNPVLWCSEDPLGCIWTRSNNFDHALALKRLVIFAVCKTGYIYLFIYIKILQFKWCVLLMRG